jgi:hypothetical protein
MTRTALAAALALFAATPALADRAPTPEETAKIAAALTAAGYVSWAKIELDEDGPNWEIDNARKEDGSKWDVTLRPNTLGALKTERDDD